MTGLGIGFFVKPSKTLPLRRASPTANAFVATKASRSKESARVRFMNFSPWVECEDENESRKKHIPIVASQLRKPCTRCHSEPPEPRSGEGRSRNPLPTQESRSVPQEPKSQEPRAKS